MRKENGKIVVQKWKPGGVRDPLADYEITIAIEQEDGRYLVVYYDDDGREVRRVENVEGVG